MEVRGTKEEIFNTLDTYINKKGLDWIKCLGFCTDGSRAINGKNSIVTQMFLKLVQIHRGLAATFTGKF